MGGELSTLVVAAHGVTSEVAVDDPGLLPGVVAVLPPGWENGDPARVPTRFVVGHGGQVCVDGATVRTDVDEPTALSTLDSALRSVVAQNAPDRVLSMPAWWPARDGRSSCLERAGLARQRWSPPWCERARRISRTSSRSSIRRDGSTPVETEAASEELRGMSSGTAARAMVP